MNIAGNLEACALHFPDQVALVDETGELTYRELNRHAEKIAAALTDYGVSAGDHVALLVPNSCLWVALYFGILKTGAVAVTLPYAMMKSELDFVLDDCRPRVIFTTRDKLPDIDGYQYAKTVVSDSGPVTYDQILSADCPEFKCVFRNPGDTAAILYTGGTTGLPKGVMLTHSNILTSAFTVARYERSCETDRALCFLPLNHVFAQVHIMNSTVLTAGGLVLQASFNLDDFLRAIPGYGITKLYAVPTIYTRLLSLPDLAERIHNVRYCFSAAASMAKELVKEWKSRTGLDIYEAYGMTESSAMVTYNHYYRHVVGSVGTPANGVEVQIRDNSGHILERGRKGEICIKGPNIMKGYLNREEETARAFWGEWFRSGDVGILDEDNYLFIVDRIKDLIITGGENVAPREIEEILYQRHEIEECAVIGLPDREYGERVTAYIVPRSGRDVDPVELKAFLKEHLSGFKVPKAFITVRDLPKTSAGKLLKRTLKEQVLDGTIAGR